MKCMNLEQTQNYTVTSQKEEGDPEYTEIPFELFDKVETMELIRGQEITISCEVKGNAEFEEAGMKFSYKVDGEDKYVDCIAKVTKSNTGKKRIWATFKMP